MRIKSGSGMHYHGATEQHFWPRMTKRALVPRPAATLVLAREAQGGIEIFMLRRTQGAAFGSGAYVFPGGALDAADSDQDLAACCSGMDDVHASRLLNLDRGGLAYWIAAVRECFEEAGLLLAYDGGGELLALDDPDRAAGFAELRRKMIAGEITLTELFRRRGLRLALDRLAYLSHWITGPGAPRRFDTRFFVAVAPPAQTPSHDAGETVSHLWIRPAEALERHRRGDYKLMFPTIKTLELLSRFAGAAAVMEHARTPRPMPAMLPHPAGGRDGPRYLVASDHAYAEVCRLDPEGKGGASYEILPGVAVGLSQKVRRITAPNPGVMTGPGTNSYLLGSGEELAVIDPGPADEAHVRILIEETRGRLRWILVTHTHQDHSPAAALLKAKTGAELLGMPPPPGESQDASFRPDRVLAHGERLDIAGCALRVIHTPGHASNQLCYLLEDEKLLFTGDHIMQGSTVVINPPDGDMIRYLASLRLLLGEDIAYLAPGHGFLMGKRSQPATLEELLPEVYDDVPERMHRVASRSLLAHLLKLQAEGRARESDRGWSIRA